MTSAEILRITKLDKNAKIPIRHSEGAAGYDLSAVKGGKINPKEILEVGTGLIFSIPKGTIGIVFGRSGLAVKNGLEIINSKVLPDSKEELVVKILNNSNKPFEFEAGSRIAQMVLIETFVCDIKEVDSLEYSARGESGFGSTGLL
ncbi:hypothetical protein P3W45_001151 [Vairimorpha bombi]|jgi:dUTP pyrophosphatase